MVVLVKKSIFKLRVNDVLRISEQRKARLEILFVVLINFSYVYAFLFLCLISCTTEY
jgi:hypothetical protein